MVSVRCGLRRGREGWCNSFGWKLNQLDQRQLPTGSGLLWEKRWPRIGLMVSSPSPPSPSPSYHHHHHHHHHHILIPILTGETTIWRATLPINCDLHDTRQPSKNDTNDTKNDTNNDTNYQWYTNNTKNSSDISFRIVNTTALLCRHQPQTAMTGLGQYQRHLSHPTKGSQYYSPSSQFSSTLLQTSMLRIFNSINHLLTKHPPEAIS